MSKTALLEELKAQMRLWRMDLADLPQGYIAHHESLALAALEVLKNDFIVHAQFMKDDGWFDGMRTLYAIVEHKRSGNLLKIHWHDGNEEFFQHHANHGGSSPLRLNLGVK